MITCPIHEIVIISLHRKSLCVFFNVLRVCVFCTTLSVYLLHFSSYKSCVYIGKVDSKKNAVKMPSTYFGYCIILTEKKILFVNETKWYKIRLSLKKHTNFITKFCYTCHILHANGDNSYICHLPRLPWAIKHRYNWYIFMLH